MEKNHTRNTFFNKNFLFKNTSNNFKYNKLCKNNNDNDDINNNKNNDKQCLLNKVKILQ